MIRICCNDVTECKGESLVIPSNGCALNHRGWPSIICKDEYAGSEIGKCAKEVVLQNGKPFESGTFFVTPPFALQRFGFSSVYHAVLSKYPGGFSSLFTVSNSMRAILDSAVKSKVKSIVFIPLGTDIEKLDYRSVAKQMASLVRQYSLNIDITVTDADKKFTKEMKKQLSMEE